MASVTQAHRDDIETILSAFRADAEENGYEEEFAETVASLIPRLHAPVEVPPRDFEFILQGDDWRERRTIKVLAGTEDEALNRLLLPLRGLPGVEVDR